MPYSIETKDGIRIDDIPDDVAQDSPELKARVEQIRASRGGQPSRPEGQPNTGVADRPSRAPQPSPSGGVSDALIEAGSEAVGATAGQAAGIPLAPVTFGMSVPVGGAIGGVAGYVAGRKMSGEKPTFGGAAAAAITGAIPGVSLAKAPAKVIAKQAVKEAAANVAAASAQSLIDRGEVPAPELVVASMAGGAVAPYIGRATDTRIALDKALKKDIDLAVKQETLKLGSERGFKVLPSHVDTNKVVGALEFLAGPSQTVAEYAHRNAAVVLGLVRKDLGMPADAVIDLPAIQAVKKEAGKAYELAESIGPRAKTAVQEFKRNRDYAASYYLSARDLNGKARTDALEEAKKYEAKRDAYWKLIGREALRSGKKGPPTDKFPGGEPILSYLEREKKRYAKAALVEEAFGEGSGVVAADIIKKARENGGKMLDGELQVIHRMAEAFPKEMSSPTGKSIPTIAFNRLATLGAAGATGGLALYGKIDPLTAAYITASVASAPSIARGIISSDSVQRGYLNKTFAEKLPQELMSMGYQKGTLALSQDERVTQPMPNMNVAPPPSVINWFGGSR